jgi:hypothetical protein
LAGNDVSDEDIKDLVKEVLEEDLNDAVISIGEEGFVKFMDNLNKNKIPNGEEIIGLDPDDTLLEMKWTIVSARSKSSASQSTKITLREFKRKFGKNPPSDWIV